MDKFKIGDKVEVVEKYNEYKVGEVGIITSINHAYYRINGDTWGAPGHYFKKVEDTIYEDQWHLNDGKVEIPYDADKLEKDGSVVAFRKRKVVHLEFGDELLDKYTGRNYRFISYYGSRKDNINVLSDKDDIVQGVELILFRQK